VTPVFSWGHGVDLFTQRRADVLFVYGSGMRKAAGAVERPLYESRFYLITKPDDPLAARDVVRPEDLAGRTLMVGGGSPPALRHIQQQVISKVGVRYFNSPDHDSTLTYVASDAGVCIAPGFLNNLSGQFAWTPFATDATIPCYLYAHANDNRAALVSFVEFAQEDIHTRAVP